MRIYLQGDVIAKTDGSQRDEAVVEAIKVAPAFVTREHSGSGRDNYTRE